MNGQVLTISNDAAARISAVAKEYGDSIDIRSFDLASHDEPALAREMLRFQAGYDASNGPIDHWTAVIADFPPGPGDQTPHWSTAPLMFGVFRWVLGAGSANLAQMAEDFADFRRRLDEDASNPLPYIDRLASHLYEELCTLLAEKETLEALLTEALGDLEAAQRRIRILENSTDQVREVQGEKDAPTRFTFLKAAATIVLAVIAPAGTYLGGRLQANADVRIAQTEQGTELVKLVASDDGAALGNTIEARMERALALANAVK